MDSTTHAQRILVIDDNQEIHKDFRKILDPVGQAGSALLDAEAFLFDKTADEQRLPAFELDSAFQGQEGLQLVQRAVKEGRPYPMAFVDVRMPPGWDGIETVAKLWEVDPDLQVVICTAYSDYSLEGITARLGRSDRLVILKKPFDVVEVLQLAGALTKKWHLLQQTRRKLENLEAQVSERTIELAAANHLLQEEIARRKGAEKARQTMEAQLRQAQKLEVVGQLAEGIAHEINAPTQHIGDNTRFLRDSFQNIRQVFESHEQMLSAAKSNSLTPELVARAEEISKAAGLR